MARNFICHCRWKGEISTGRSLCFILSVFRIKICLSFLSLFLLTYLMQIFCYIPVLVILIVSTLKCWRLLSSLSLFHSLHLLYHLVHLLLSGEFEGKKSFVEFFKTFAFLSRFLSSHLLIATEESLVLSLPYCLFLKSH